MGFRFPKFLTDDIQRQCCCLKTYKCYFKHQQNVNVLEQHVEHNHPIPDEQLLNEQKISNSLKRKTIKDVLSKPSKLLHVEFKNKDVKTMKINDVTLI